MFGTPSRFGMDYLEENHFRIQAILSLITKVNDNLE